MKRWPLKMVICPDHPDLPIGGLMDEDCACIEHVPGQAPPMQEVPVVPKARADELLKAAMRAAPYMWNAPFEGALDVHDALVDACRHYEREVGE